MKYLLLIHSNPGNWEALSPSERDSMIAEYQAFGKEIMDSGEHIDSSQLADPSTAQRVRVRSGGTQVVDGPFAESKEQLAGYYLVQCDSQKRAVELAAKIPGAKFADVEVLPCLDNGGQEM